MTQPPPPSSPSGPLAPQPAGWNQPGSQPGGGWNQPPGAPAPATKPSKAPKVLIILGAVVLALSLVIGIVVAVIGFGGVAKMSSSRGGAPVPADALAVMEAPVLRWLYARRRMNQSFDVAFGSELQRTYDEWDALQRKAAAGTAQAAELAALERATSTAHERLPETPRRVAYRTLASVVDITFGDEAQVLRDYGTRARPDVVASFGLHRYAWPACLLVTLPWFTHRRVPRIPVADVSFHRGLGHLTLRVGEFACLPDDPAAETPGARVVPD